MKKTLLSALGILAVSAMAAIWIFPARTAAWLLARLVPYPASFTGARFTAPPDLEYAGLQIRHPSARFESSALSVKLRPRLAPPGVRLEGDFKKVRVEPDRGPLKRPFGFETGRFMIEGRKNRTRLLALDGWKSDILEFRGTVLLDSEGQVLEISLNGLLDAAEARRVWLDLEGGGDTAGKVPFEISLKEGLLEVRLDGKIFFSSRFRFRTKARAARLSGAGIMLKYGA